MAESGFRIKTCVLGMVSTNCYLVYHETTKKGVIIDPADNGEYLVRKLKELGVTPEAVLLTHGHFDHILAVKDIQEEYSCGIYAGKEEDRMLQDPSMNLTGTMGGDESSISADYLVQDGQTMELAGFTWKVLETPGHTRGSVCYYIPSEDVLISGDTLFAESLGRTDLPTGSMQEIVASITEKLLVLPEDTMVYPGHGDPTTIGHERLYNPAAVYRKRRG